MQIEISPAGNIGNRIIQYIGARHLQRLLPGSELAGASIPELGLTGPPSNRGEPCLIVPAHAGTAISAVVEQLLGGRFNRVLIYDHLQRLDWLGERADAAAVIPHVKGGLKISADELLINIRSGEIVDGVSHYPLVPVPWYARIIALTGLRPVFMGQTQGNAYAAALRAAYPEGKFVPSQGAAADFETVRSARHIVPAVSTFSWVAAWLSEAERIYLPLLGFLNPAHVMDRKIDLVMADDPRCRFFLFPLHYGVYEGQALPRHAELAAMCREISPANVEHLQRREPFIPVAGEVEDFDAYWYVNQDMLAGMELAELKYASAAAHYLDIGQRRGRTPMPEHFSYAEVAREGLVDLALGKDALQSSIHAESFGRSVAEDAGRAVRGAPIIPFAMHTDWEVAPWWQVDLRRVCTIAEVRVLNRIESEGHCVRAAPLTARISFDGVWWLDLFTTPEGLVFGRDGRKLIWRGAEVVKARYLRLEVRRLTCLHLCQVEVLGTM